MEMLREMEMLMVEIDASIRTTHIERCLTYTQYV